MEQNVRVGVAAIIRDGNKILLGHRSKNKPDTGGIIGRDTWSLPGGKQEYDEKIETAVIREVKEETNLDISNLELVGVCDDIAPDRHFITVTYVTDTYEGKPVVMEPTKEDEWKWFDIDNLPENLYEPSKNSLNVYKERLGKMERIINGRKVFKAGTIVQHFKRELMTEKDLKENPNGYLYEIIGTSRHTENKEELMNYLPLYYTECVDGVDYASRPLDMFMSEVDHEKYPEVKQKYRFEEFKGKVK